MITFPEPSHMPFIAFGPAPDFRPQAFCCLPVGGRWKMHIQDAGGQWRRIDTGLPDDATECSPTAEWGEEGWRISFVAGGAEEMRVFRLCRIYGTGPAVHLCAADVGFVWKDTVAHAGRRGTLLIEEPGRTREVRFLNVEFLYRVSYNPERPKELLISGQKFTGEIFSWIYHPGRNLYRLTADGGKTAYKAARCQGIFYYSEQFGQSFDDRRIVRAGSVETEPLDISREIREEWRPATVQEYEDHDFE